MGGPSWLGALTLGDAVACAGFMTAMAGLALNTFQIRLVVRQLRLDAIIRITDSSRCMAAVGIEHPDLWGAIQVSEPSSLHDAFRRDRFIQLWLNHVLMVWKCWQHGMLEAGEWEACCRDIGSLAALPAVQEEWLRVRDFYPRGFQRELARVSNGAVTAADSP